MTDLIDRLRAYREDAPADGAHSDAAGANAYELIDECSSELVRLSGLWIYECHGRFVGVF